MEEKELYDRLSREAVRAAEFSYSPYSHFRVGAALLAGNGKIYTGCNVENASYPVGICAERTALCKAVSEGERRFRALAVTGGREGRGMAAPCGMCRQALREFCGPDFIILLVEDVNKYEIRTLGQLLPDSFGPENFGSTGADIR
ncbi:MAG TPA: cytidine deaminase [Candidatus Scatomonas pullistercoris]|uniref:Cytidine deaminase n=1 Tax=Candidatus Scatomonas pullistercoris TaxID=2840920 RepID=A0A9D1P226_9FIRM|nr:cytidine deaminase [Candidatus Scatomonas pullistercoris]